MKALKTALVITVAVLFSMACSTPSDSGNKPAAPAANTNASSPAVVSNPTANSNQPGQPAIGDKGSAPAANPAAANPSELAKVFNEKCALCHGEDGKGKVKGAPDFTNAEWQKKETDAEFADMIKVGKKPTMPAFADKLSDEQIKALVGYVRSFAKK
jgi:mono/diheme cytochrome c family protein